MKSMNYFLFVIFFLFFACEKQNLSPDSEGDLNVPKGILKASIDMINAPSDVVGLEGKLYNDDGDEIYFDFEIEGYTASATVENILSGIWMLKVDAFDENNIILYTGTTEVTVYPGIVTPVSIHLNPVTGSLEIAVTWGDGDDQFEDNDQQSDAASLWEYTYYYNLIVFADDDDWYEMVISADSLSIACYFIHSNGDINIDLVDYNGTILATSQGTIDDEQINFIVDQLGTYYIHVYLDSGYSNSYTIWWDDIWSEGI